MDGSAAPFVQMVHEAGVRELEAKRGYLVIKKPVTVRGRATRRPRLSPRAFRVSCTIDFKHPLISTSPSRWIRLTAASSGEIAPARTFGFLRDVEMLKKLGLARGGSLENAIVVDDSSILNPDGLRFPDEFVRHKILDADRRHVALRPPVIGHLVAHRGGHALHTAFAAQVLAEADAWTLVEGGVDGGGRFGGGDCADSRQLARPGLIETDTPHRTHSQKSARAGSTRDARNPSGSTGASSRAAAPPRRLRRSTVRPAAAAAARDAPGENAKTS